MNGSDVVCHKRASSIESAGIDNVSWICDVQLSYTGKAQSLGYSVCERYFWEMMLNASLEISFYIM
jgi:hypothetical protein